MLRNCCVTWNLPRLSVLNEVLSLNAQELTWLRNLPQHCRILNEVLSLNAQESVPEADLVQLVVSSMKS